MKVGDYCSNAFCTIPCELPHAGGRAAADSLESREREIRELFLRMRFPSHCASSANTEQRSKPLQPDGHRRGKGAEAHWSRLVASQKSPFNFRGSLCTRELSIEVRVLRPAASQRQDGQEGESEEGKRRGGRGPDQEGRGGGPGRRKKPHKPDKEERKRKREERAAEAAAAANAAGGGGDATKSTRDSKRAKIDPPGTVYPILVRGLGGVSVADLRDLFS